MIAIIVVAFNLLGDGLRDALDPKAALASAPQFSATAGCRKVPADHGEIITLKEIRWATYRKRLRRGVAAAAVVAVSLAGCGGGLQR